MLPCQAGNRSRRKKLPLEAIRVAIRPIIKRHGQPIAGNALGLANRPACALVVARALVVLEEAAMVDIQHQASAGAQLSADLAQDIGVAGGVEVAEALP